MISRIADSQMMISRIADRLPPLIII